MQHASQKIHDRSYNNYELSKKHMLALSPSQRSFQPQVPSYLRF